MTDIHNTAASTAVNAASVEQFKLERYKYILKQMHFLDENLHRYLTLFQTLATAIVAAAAAIFISWRRLGVDAEMAQITLWSLLCLFLALATFVLLSIVSGIFSWLDYRREEVVLLDEAVRPGFRAPPNVRNFWRWPETYMVLIILIIAAGAFAFVSWIIIPAVR